MPACFTHAAINYTNNTVFMESSRARFCVSGWLGGLTEHWTEVSDELITQ
jgi:hypothetical protein